MDRQHTLSTMQVSPAKLESLYTMANRLRRHSILATSKAKSGHPTSCMSCAEIVSTLFFEFLRFSVDDPENLDNDRFILSKGHAAPILFAAWAEAGAFPTEKLLTIRDIDSDLEGHPTPRNPYVDVATGSLGQGLSAGIGMALASRMDDRQNRIYVLMGDGEVAEGSVWEGVQLASYYNLNNLIAIVDVNRLGQSQGTMIEHQMQTYESRFYSFGWHTHVVDGHDIEQLVDAFGAAINAIDRPTVILCRTIKGKGVSFLEDRLGWHGKPIADDEVDKALAEIGNGLHLQEELHIQPPFRSGLSASHEATAIGQVVSPNYEFGSKEATRKAYGKGLAKLGASVPSVVALDGDVKNSTYSEIFAKEFPTRFTECFIAEQNMVGIAVGLSAVGKIPFASSFACFLTRAYDQIRMAAISQANIKLCGSHVGVSIGEDGPSQMGLEDIAMMRAVHGSTVLYPSDAVCAERMVELAAATQGIVYIRTSRPATPILYKNDESFRIGGCKVLRSSPNDKATVIAAGVTLHEALKAYDLLQRDGISIRIIDLYSVKPLDTATLHQAARETGSVLTVEDHYPEGGLGDAVFSELAGENCKFCKLAVNQLPRSGDAYKLMELVGISARCIVKAIREL